mgnify:CR=1 FL=1
MMPRLGCLLGAAGALTLLPACNLDCTGAGCSGDYLASELGLHLGQEDLAEAPLEDIRRSGIRLGVSTHGYAEMLLADRVAPSYLALGAVYATNLKVMPT